MRSVSNRTRIGLLAAFTAFSAVLSTGSAAAATELNGDWAPFDRCPVDAPAMLAADGITNIATCISSSSVTGSITPVPTGNSDLQLGVIQHNNGTSTLVAPPEELCLLSPERRIGGGRSDVRGRLSPIRANFPPARRRRTSRSRRYCRSRRGREANRPADVSVEVGLGAGPGARPVHRTGGDHPVGRRRADRTQLRRRARRRRLVAAARSPRGRPAGRGRRGGGQPGRRRWSRRRWRRAHRHRRRPHRRVRQPRTCHDHARRAGPHPRLLHPGRHPHLAPGARRHLRARRRRGTPARPHHRPRQHRPGGPFTERPRPR
ncbi:hypothetical protein SMICM17S_11736 [Streptomyces microflavus]